MPVAEEINYLHCAKQRIEVSREVRKEDPDEDKLLMIFKFFKLRVSRRHAGGPIIYDTYERLAREDLWVSISDFKSQLSPSNPNRNTDEYERQICRCLTTMSVPEDEHRAVIQKIFQTVPAVESTQLPIVVGVWETNALRDRPRPGPYTRPPVRAKVTPAAISAIEGLKALVQVDESLLRQTPSCAVCLEDFLDHQKLPITELPCRHRFHVHCIVQCLEINHLCPLCRYAMPT